MIQDCQSVTQQIHTYVGGFPAPPFPNMPMTLALAFADIPLPLAFELPVPPLRTDPLRKTTAESENCYLPAGTFNPKP